MTCPALGEALRAVTPESKLCPLVASNLAEGLRCTTLKAHAGSCKALALAPREGRTGGAEVWRGPRGPVRSVGAQE